MAEVEAAPEALVLRVGDDLPDAAGRLGEVLGVGTVAPEHGVAGRLESRANLIGRAELAARERQHELGVAALADVLDQTLAHAGDVAVAP